MIRINLLPHREQKRKALQSRYLLLFSFFCVLTLALAFVGYMILHTKIKDQDQRNAFLEQVNKKLDQDIIEIERLKADRQALLDRKAIVESLQANRTMAVQIMDQLVRKTPEGIYLTEVKQSGNRINLSGYAQSNARVSSFMRNLDDSSIFNSTVLIQTKAETVGNRRVSGFELNTQIASEKKETASQPAAAVNRGHE